MFEKEKYIPIYIQIKKDLSLKIDKLDPDSKIPSENELCSFYGVSRATVKQAISELVREEKLYRIQGKGTFVSHSKIKRSFNILPSFTDEIRRGGTEPVSVVQFFGYINNKPEAVSALKLNGSSNVLCYSRVIFANDVPVALANSYIHPTIFKDLKADMIKNSLYKALIKNFNQAPVKAVDSYHATTASKPVAQILKVPEHSPILYSVRIASLSNDTPVEYVESYIRGDQYYIEIDIDTQNRQSFLSQSIERY